MELWRLLLKSTRLQAAYFTTQTLSFSMDCSYTRLPQLVLFSCLEIDCSAEEVVKIHMGKPPHCDRINTCLHIINPHLAHFLPVYGITSRCPIDRIQVASEVLMRTADSDPLFWTCSDLTVQRSFGLFENHWT